MENMLRVGVVANTHGIKGEVKVFPTTDDIERFKLLKDVFLDTGGGILSLEVESVRFFKKMVILKFKGVNDINEVETYKGKDLLVTRKNAVPLKENEYFIYDMIGAKVYLEDGSLFGELVEVLTTGANDVYVVWNQENKEILLPVIKECILNVDVEKKCVIARVLPGLL